jgi:hypothetical protein
LENLSGKFEIFRTRNNDLDYFEVNFWKTKVKDIRVKTSSTKENFLDGFKRLNLMQNHKYFGSKQVNYRGFYYDLIKTNERCAFINFYGVEKRILLKSIKNVKNM